MIVKQRTAEIARQQATDIAEILGEDRPIEAELRAQFCDRRRIRRDTALGEQEFRRIARDEVNDEEDERNDRPDQPERDGYACQRVGEHPLTPPSRFRTWTLSRR